MTDIPHQLRRGAISLVDIDESGFLRWLKLVGHIYGIPTAPHYLRRAEGKIPRWRRILEPKAAFSTVRILEVRLENQEVMFRAGPGLRMRGKEIALCLRESELASMSIVTMGPEADSFDHRLREEDPTIAKLFKSYGWFCLRSAMRGVSEKVEEMARRHGLAITSPVHPGGPLDKWGKANQKTLFSIIDAGFTGVTLNRDGSMTPSLTISYIIGLGSSLRETKGKPSDTQCLTCSNARCPGKKALAILEKEGFS